MCKPGKDEKDSLFFNPRKSCHSRRIGQAKPWCQSVCRVSHMGGAKTSFWWCCPKEWPRDLCLRSTLKICRISYRIKVNSEDIGKGSHFGE